jgi:hypothetical protein
MSSGKEEAMPGRARSKLAREARTWLVEGGGQGWHGEVEAIDLAAAEAEARRRWPGAAKIYDGSKSAMESTRRRLQARIDRDPGPYAYHEAGHAVVGTLGEGKRRVDRVEIRATCPLEGDFHYLGSTRWKPDRPGSRHQFDHEKPCVAYARIIETLAGRLAEWLHRRGKRAPRLQASDLGCVNYYASHHCRCESLSAYGPNVVQEQLIVWLDGRARRTVAHHWDQIEHVARALIERRELSGEEVKRLMGEIGPNSGSPEDIQERLRFFRLVR